MPENPLANIAVILVGTRAPANIGAAARAMHNMGIGELRLVAPEHGIDQESYRLARSGAPILDGARRHGSLAGALRGIHLVVGTTGKSGGNRASVETPRALAPRIVEAASASQRVGIVFGPEDTGLVDDDLLLCQLLARIPTAPGGASLNLAAAVLVLCYEARLASLAGTLRPGERLAPAASVEAMYAQLEAALGAIGFLHEKNARHMMFRLRRFFGRAGWTPAEVAMVRGIARQMVWSSTRTPRS